MIRKKAWPNDSQRHAMAARGISSTLREFESDIETSQHQNKNIEKEQKEKLSQYILSNLPFATKTFNLVIDSDKPDWILIMYTIEFEDELLIPDEEYSKFYEEYGGESHNKDESGRYIYSEPSKKPHISTQYHPYWRHYDKSHEKNVQAIKRVEMHTSLENLDDSLSVLQKMENELRKHNIPRKEVLA